PTRAAAVHGVCCPTLIHFLAFSPPFMASPLSRLTQRLGRGVTPLSPVRSCSSTLRRLADCSTIPVTCSRFLFSPVGEGRTSTLSTVIPVVEGASRCT